ncbi:MAG TPA: excinuclease ABC subunit UvrC [Micropepsaceae bacterium]|nr:excinuclease ABC subunit UvrC [Micropepsaceae bacterium]
MDDKPLTPAPGDMPQGSSSEEPLKGPERIAAYLKTLPDGPGVYRMLNAKGEVLYVGKASSLKKRVASYAKGGSHSNRIAHMISETAEMIFVSTQSDVEALLLESNLIKRLKPRYNVSYRDDKSFPNILLRTDHPFPQVLKHRGAKSRDGIYFGPFASAGAVNMTLNTLQRAFLLRSCSDAVFQGRTRPCLLYQIKRCSAPCTGRIDAEGYAALVDQAKTFLTGKSRMVQEQLAREMHEAAERMDFERAAQLRDRIRAMSHIHSRQGINPTSFTEADVFALYREGTQSCMQVFFFRAGQNWGNRPFFPRHGADLTNGEVLASFLSQFYDTRIAPSLILLSEDVPECALIAEALSVRAGHRVEIAVPQRGEKREIVEAALQNARAQLARNQAENASQRALLEGIAETFGLEAPAKRIEVYDNSHIQGANAVGAMIVAGPEGFQKAEYRKFNIKSEDLTPGDDIGMMREVLTRRFGRLVRESSEGAPDDKWTKWPDLVLIDGGPAQLEAAHAALAEVGADDVVIVGVAKSIEREAGREHFYRQGQAPFRLDAKSPVLYYLQRLRDEAHRFAIGSHRKKRSKAIGASPLEEIAGVGARRKKALLAHFGSARGVTQASLADLETVDGVSSALARKIYDFFHTD